jgi:hypothetical protein
MIQKIKATVKKIILQLGGGFSHLKPTVKVGKKWYGNDYGGFFVAPAFINNHSIVYSFGIGEDVSFDESVIKHHNCKV